MSASIALELRETEPSQRREATHLPPSLLPPHWAKLGGKGGYIIWCWSGFLVVRERERKQAMGFLSVSWWPFPYFILSDPREALMMPSGGLADLTTREYQGAETGYYWSGGSEGQFMLFSALGE